jgi:drug/metabolite transporter (DMT)-like permease
MSSPATPLLVAKDRRPVFVLIFVTALWGSTFVVTKDVVESAPPFLYLLLRFAVGAIVLAIAARNEWRRIDRRLLVDGMLLGLLAGAGVGFQIFGQAFTTASKSAFITAFYMPLTPLIGYGMYRHRASVQHLLSMAIACVGIVMLTYPGAAAYNRGDIIMLCSALVYGFQIVELAKRTPGHSVALMALAQVVVAAIFFAAITLALHFAPQWFTPALAILERRPLVWSSRFILELVFMGVVNTALTNLGQTWALARMKANQASVIFSLEPVFATTLALAVYGAAEWPGVVGASGGMLVIAAVFISARTP